ncbi:MAG: GtrA family protein [Candidatus Paceibacterota bacterium]
MRKRDVALAIIAGIITGAIWAAVFLRLGTLDFLHIGAGVWGLVVLTPIGFVFGLYLGKWLSVRWHIFTSFARFTIVGFMNAGIDFGVFNFLMFWTNIEEGVAVSTFKGISFVAAVINSYYWNKYWVFEASGTGSRAKEFLSFLIVTVIGLLVNVGVTSLVVFGIDPKFGFSQLSWNNIAAVFGAIFGLVWNFVGYRLIVFKKEAAVENTQIEG